MEIKTKNVQYYFLSLFQTNDCKKNNRFYTRNLMENVAQI